MISNLEQVGINLRLNVSRSDETVIANAHAESSQICGDGIRRKPALPQPVSDFPE
jgi:hypothetical protein